MFGLFKKRGTTPSAVEPHPQHGLFVRRSIPIALTINRGGFLVEMSKVGASQMVQEIWSNGGTVFLPPKFLTPPTGLRVFCIRHDKYFCHLIIFPTPNKVAGESFFGFIVAGPSDDWSQEACVKVPVRYFILERTTTEIPKSLSGAHRPEKTTKFSTISALVHLRRIHGSLS